VPDLLNRDFTVGAPNRKYVGDITYLPLATGANLYLATPGPTAGPVPIEAQEYRPPGSMQLIATTKPCLRRPTKPPSGCARA
jgi:hypothetical protein